MYEFLIVLTVAMLTVLIIRMLKKAFTDVYFSFSQLIATNGKDITIRGIFLQFVPAIIGSSILFFMKFNLGYIILYGFLTAFFIIWPVLLYPALLLDKEVYQKRVTLYLLYFFYIIFLCFISYSTYFVITLFARIDTPFNEMFTLLLDGYIELHPLVQNIIGGLITAALLYVLSRLIKNLTKVISIR